MRKFDLANKKIRVTPETSAMVQKIAFENGFEWSDGKIIQLTEYPHLYFGEYRGNSITFGLSDISEYFDSHRFTEITLADLGITPEQAEDWDEVVDEYNASVKGNRPRPEIWWDKFFEHLKKNYTIKKR